MEKKLIKRKTIGSGSNVKTDNLEVKTLVVYDETKLVFKRKTFKKVDKKPTDSFDKLACVSSCCCSVLGVLIGFLEIFNKTNAQ